MIGGHELGKEQIGPLFEVAKFHVDVIYGC